MNDSRHNFPFPIPDWVRCMAQDRSGLWSGCAWKNCFLPQRCTEFFYLCEI